MPPDDVDAVQGWLCRYPLSITAIPEPLIGELQLEVLARLVAMKHPAHSQGTILPLPLSFPSSLKRIDAFMERLGLKRLED